MRGVFIVAGTYECVSARVATLFLFVVYFAQTFDVRERLFSLFDWKLHQPSQDAQVSEVPEGSLLRSVQLSSSLFFTSNFLYEILYIYSI